MPKLKYDEIRKRHLSDEQVELVMSHIRANAAFDEDFFYNGIIALATDTGNVNEVKTCESYYLQDMRLLYVEEAYKSIQKQLSPDHIQTISEKYYCPETAVCTAQQYAASVKHDQGLLKKKLTGLRPWVFEAESASRIAQSIGMGPHEFGFGTAKPVMLPPTLAAFAGYCGKMSVEHRTEFNELSMFLDKLLKQYRADENESLSVLAADRFMELVAYSGMSVVSFLAPDHDFFQNGTDALHITKIHSKLADGNLDVDLITALYLAYECRTSADYFFVRDYTRWSPVCYSDKDGNAVPVLDRSVLKIISKYLLLDSSGQAEGLKALDGAVALSIATQ